VAVTPEETADDLSASGALQTVSLGVGPAGNGRGSVTKIRSLGFGSGERSSTEGGVGWGGRDTRWEPCRRCGSVRRVTSDDDERARKKTKARFCGGRFFTQAGAEPRSHMTLVTHAPTRVQPYFTPCTYSGTAVRSEGPKAATELNKPAAAGTESPAATSASKRQSVPPWIKNAPVGVRQPGRSFRKAAV
jgi:hypothetical protein